MLTKVQYIGVAVKWEHLKKLEIIIFFFINRKHMLEN